MTTNTRLRRELRRGNTWTEKDGARIYWCWWVRAGAMGQLVVRRTLIGRLS